MTPEQAAFLIKQRREQLTAQANADAQELFMRRKKSAEYAEKIQQGRKQKLSKRRQVILNRTYYTLAADMLALWHSMRARCARDPSYKGRVFVCPRWESFNNFWADMREKPSPAHSLGRIDNDGDYSPENCRWELPFQQAANRRFTRGASWFPGVYWENSTGRWRAEGRLKGQRFRLYSGPSFEKAVEARRNWELTVQAPVLDNRSRGR